MSRAKKPKLAFWKFASCDGCQMTLHDCEDELLAVAAEIEIANFAEATSTVIKGRVRTRTLSGLSAATTGGRKLLEKKVKLLKNRQAFGAVELRAFLNKFG